MWKSIVMPKIRNTPAAPATTAPLVSFEILLVISVLASSISSRTSSDAFSETSDTISPSVLSADRSGPARQRSSATILLMIRASASPPTNAPPDEDLG